jgi:hypothetical protein
VRNLSKGTWKYVLRTGAPCMILAVQVANTVMVFVGYFIMVLQSQTVRGRVTGER